MLGVLIRHLRRMSAQEMKYKITPPLDSPEVLLHSCCAPCSGAILECMLDNGLKPVVYFSNANIYPFEEYAVRMQELKRYCESLGIECVEDRYEHPQWLQAVRGLEREPERGLRCEQCFKFRLLRAAKFARSRGIRQISTSLASSRWKDLEQVNRAGQWACEQANMGVEDDKKVIWWPQNWRKGGLQPRRNEIIKEQNFYNQLFCGCEFAKNL